MGCPKLTYFEELPTLKVAYSKHLAVENCCIEIFNFTRKSSAGTYRYGFQGQEKDEEIKGEGNSVNYKYRMHDPRLGRFFATDPLAAQFAWNSPYAFSENRVIDAIELEGLESVILAFQGGVFGDAKAISKGTTSDIVNSVTASSGETMNIKGVAISTGNEKATLKTALDFTISNYDKSKGGKIVVYGYSAGGARAINFAQQLQEKGYIVDLLVTVDAAMGPISDEIDRRVPLNVKKAVNFFQDDASLIGSKGSFNEDNDPGGWYGQELFEVPVGYDVENVNHGTIDEVVKPISISLIKEAFGVGFDPYADYDLSAGQKDSGTRNTVGSSVQSPIAGSSVDSSVESIVK